MDSDHRAFQVSSSPGFSVMTVQPRMVLGTHTYENSWVDPRKIWLPRLSRPAAIHPGEEFAVHLSDCSGQELTVTLEDEEETRRLSLLKRQDRSNNCSDLTCMVPTDVNPALYDPVICENGTRTAFEPNSVWVRDPGGQGFTCAHVTDWHIYKARAEPPDRTDAVERMMRILAEDIKPDFIINTGDLGSCLHQHPIFKVLYGHTRTPCLQPEHADFDGGLWPAEDFQVLALNAEGLELARYSLA